MEATLRVPEPPPERVWSSLQADKTSLSPQLRLARAGWVRELALDRCELEVGPAERSRPAWETLRVEGPAAETCLAIVASLDGSLTLREASARAGTPLEASLGALRELYELGVLVTTDREAVPAPAFYEHLRSTCRYRLLHWGPTAALARFASGPVTRRLALGYLIENFHFAAAASSHQGAAVASMPSLRLKTAFSEHLAIEYWHFAWLQRGLAAAGLSEADLARAVPLPSNLAQINQLRWLAVSDPLSYAGCIGVVEGDATEAPSIRQFWQRFAAHGLLPEEAFGPFREHALGDCEGNHDSFGGELFHESGMLSALEQARIRERVLCYCRLAWEHHKQLVDFYGPAEGPAYFCLED